MVVYRIHADLEKLRHQSLRQPDSLVLKPALDARLSVLRLVEDDALLQLFVV